MITLTENAVKQLKIISVKTDEKYFRFGASGGGCSGYSFIFRPLNEKESNEIFNRDWEEVGKNWRLIREDDIIIYVDVKSYFLLNGTEIDWEEDEMGLGRFTYNNNNINNYCGCGASFSISKEGS